MSDILLNSSHDVEFSGNDISIVTGLDERIQRLKQNLKYFLSEWFLNTGEGIPYFQEIFVKQVDPDRVDAVFKEAILNTHGVIELLTFELDLDEQTRKLTLTFSARFDEGVVEISEAL